MPSSNMYICLDDFPEVHPEACRGQSNDVGDSEEAVGDRAEALEDRAEALGDRAQAFEFRATLLRLGQSS